MKKKIAALLALTVLAGAFSGCGTSGGSAGGFGDVHGPRL